MSRKEKPKVVPFAELPYADLREGGQMRNGKDKFTYTWRNLTEGELREFNKRKRRWLNEQVNILKHRRVDIEETHSYSFKAGDDLAEGCW